MGKVESRQAKQDSEVSSKQDEMDNCFGDSSLQRMWKKINELSPSGTSLFIDSLVFTGGWTVFATLLRNERMQLQSNAKTNSFIFLVYPD